MRYQDESTRQAARWQAGRALGVGTLGGVLAGIWMVALGNHTLANAAVGAFVVAVGLYAAQYSRAAWLEMRRLACAWSTAEFLLGQRDAKRTREVADAADSR